jgi:hypothetical protein
MYKLPSDFDEQLLSGCYLEMVSFGPAIIKLDFARPQHSAGKPYKVTFCVEGGLTFSRGGETGKRELSDPASCVPLIGFLLQDVLDVTQFGCASLQLSFGEEGQIFIEASELAEFESYSIYLSTGEVIVV